LYLDTVHSVILLTAKLVVRHQSQEIRQRDTCGRTTDSVTLDVFGLHGGHATVTD